MSENFSKLPQAIQDFKTPYSDLVVMRTHTEGTYFIRTFITSSENQKVCLDVDGKLVSNEKFVLHEYGTTYNELTDAWATPSGKKTVPNGGAIPTVNSLTSPADIEQVLYSTVDLYDSTYTEIQREKDARVNCLADDYFTLNEQVLKIEQISEVYDANTDGLLIAADSDTYFYVFVIKNVGDTYLQVNYKSYFYLYPSAPVTVHKFTITRKDTTYKTSSTKEYGTGDYIYFKNPTSSWLREDIMFTTMPMISKMTETLGLELIKAQKMPVSDRPFEKPVIHSFTMTPEQPKEGENVSFIYDATYDRASFVAEEWENKQASYEAGSHTVKVRVQDSNGLWSDWAVLSFNVAAVYSLPTISNLRMEPSNPSVGEKVSFIYDKNMDSRLTLKAENWGNKKDSYESGTHTVTLSITDSADQTSNTLSHTFTIEKPLENFTISNLKMTPPNPKAGEKVDFSYEVNNDDRLTIVEEKWENKQASYEAGTHTVTVSAVDSAGRTSNTLSLTFEVAYVPEKPVLTVINMTPANPYSDETVEFTYQAAIDEQATIKEEIWENKQSMYTPGRHEVSLTIVDSFNQSSNRLTYEFEVQRRKQMPVIRDLVVKTQNPTTNDVIEFEYGMTLDPEATLLKENWENKREKYPAGVHTVKLSITDSLNQVSNVLEVTFTVLDAEALPDVPSQFPYIYDIIVDPPQPRAGELLSYSYTVALEAGTEIETMSWKGRRMVYEEAGDVEMALKIVDSKGQTAEKTVSVSIDEPSELPQAPKPTRIKHLEVTRWDSAYKRFMILEGREK